MDICDFDYLKGILYLECPILEIPLYCHSVLHTKVEEIRQDAVGGATIVWNAKCYAFVKALDCFQATGAPERSSMYVHEKQPSSPELNKLVRRLTVHTFVSQNQFGPLWAWVLLRNSLTRLFRYSSKASQKAFTVKEQHLV